MPHRSQHRPPPRDLREQWFCRIYDSKVPFYAHAIGIPYRSEEKIAARPELVDHVWLTLQVPPCGALLVAVNTLSRKNRDAGYDERINVGIVPSRYTELPEPLIEESEGLNYGVIESQSSVAYTAYEHEVLSKMLIARAHAALRIEAWGELYRRGELGMHQVHSRRASCAVDNDIVGHDGALRFYFRDGTAELFLFKFCGQ